MPEQADIEKDYIIIFINVWNSPRWIYQRSELPVQSHSSRRLGVSGTEKEHLRNTRKEIKKLDISHGNVSIALCRN